MTKTEEIRNYLGMYGSDKNTQDICDAVGCAPRTVQQARKDYVELLSMNLEYICEGCEKADTELYQCRNYAQPPSYYVRQGCCPFNRPKVEITKKKTKGQQKQRKLI